MRPPRSRGSKFAIGSTAAILGLGFTLGAVPALAAQGAPPRVPAAGMHRLIVPTSGPVGVAPSGPRSAKTFVGAATRVSKAEFLHSGGHAYPALPAPSGTVQGGSEQAASSISNGAYTPLSPTRLLDTRTNGETLGPNSSLNLLVLGGSVPADASAVALNVTVTDTTSDSFLTVYPTGQPLPLVSNLNWPSGETVPNLVIVPVGLGGEVTFYNDQGRTDVVVDLEGYFAPEPSNSTTGSYVPLTPSRIVDTRAGSGEPYSGDTLGPGGSLNIQVAGRGGVPASGVSAALMNVTVTDTTAPSYLTVYPQGDSQPLASNLNWLGGDTVANRVVVPVNPTTGQITVYNDQGNTDVVVDVDGYFTNGGTPPANAGLFSTISPIRLLDTRTTGQALGPGGILTHQLAGVDGIAPQATAVVTNVTVTDTTAPSYLTVYPGPTRPLASDVNWLPGQTVPNLTVATLSSGGSISVYNDQGNTDVVVDAFGYFGPRMPVSITTTSLTSGSVGSSYSAVLQAAGGTAPYSWVLAVGSLPTGLTLSASGMIQGTPTAAGTSNFTVQVTDSTTPTPETASTQLSLTVTPAPLAITTTSLPTGVAGALYSAAVQATGGTPPYSWSVASGSLPAGLALSAAGVISGTPAASGTFDFGIAVTDSASPYPNVTISSLTLQIAPALAVTTTSLPSATVGSPYSRSLGASGGTPPYSWAITSGSLPAGLSLSSSGLISGTPTTYAVSSFTVQVTDSTTPTHETATGQLSIQVYLGPPVAAYSSNWSGYVYGEGPYTAIQGTFNIPQIYANSVNTDTAEWVGIDGWNGDSALIQAGIDEPYDAATNTYTIYAWWEILPAYPTEVQIPFSDITPSPGDSITVTIGQVGAGTWGIEVVDNTNGESFLIDQAYSAALSSAEWIVEAPTLNGSIETLGGYSPNVTFTGLGLAGPQNTFYDVAMVQNGGQVSTPSTLDPTGFAVAYGDVAPPPP